MKKRVKTMMTKTNNIVVVGALFSIGIIGVFILTFFLLGSQKNSTQIVHISQGVVAGAQTVGRQNSDLFSVRHLHKSQLFTDFDSESLSAESVVVMDFKMSDILFKKNADAPQTLASLTKLITALYLYERGFSGTAQASVSPETIRATIQSYAIPLNPLARVSQIKVEDEEVFDATTLLRATLIASANNMASALVASQGLAPSSFITGLEKYLKEHGYSATYIFDPTGLHPGNVSTASEFARLAVQAFTYKDIRDASTTSSMTLVSQNTGRTFSAQTTNRLLATRAQEILGGKTGFLDEAKYTYVTAVRHASGRELLIVVLGADSSEARFLEASTLIDWLNASYE